MNKAHCRCGETVALIDEDDIRDFTNSEMTCDKCGWKGYWEIY